MVTADKLRAILGVDEARVVDLPVIRAEVNEGRGEQWPLSVIKKIHEGRSSYKITKQLDGLQVKPRRVVRRPSRPASADG